MIPCMTGQGDDLGILLGAVRVDCGSFGHAMANLSNDAAPAPVWAFRSKARNQPR
jgi:hypothetical protein